MFDKVTIKDISELVGVSKATVSYYLNGNFNKMSVATREKIRKAIEITGYQPSAIAKGLATQDTKTLGVVIADITNPFVSSVMKGIHDSCLLYGYSVNFTNSDNNLQIELENLNRLAQQKVSGVILDSVSADNPIIKTLDSKKTVMVDRQSRHLSVDTIVAENENSTYSFINKMRDAGYEKIYFVSYPVEGISTRELRYKGFKRAMSVDHDEYLLNIEDSNIQGRIKKIIQNRECRIGFFTMNGPTLLQFVKHTKNLPYRYPEDYGLGSYEDLNWMDLLSPSISCVRQDSYQIGKIAAEHLIHKINNEDSSQSPRIIEIPNEIVLRYSF